MAEVLQVKTFAYENHRLLSYHDNGFCDMIITLSILLHITTISNGFWTCHFILRIYALKLNSQHYCMYYKLFKFFFTVVVM